MHMKKFSLLVCLLTLLLCACEVNPTAATTDAQPTEATSAATETTEVTTAQETEIPRYTVSFTTDALAEVLGNIEDKARNGEEYASVYEVVAEEDNEILLQIYCDAEGYTSVTRVTYHGKTYDVRISAFYGGFLDILYLPDLLIFGEHGASAPGDSYYFFYDSGMCGYNGKELLLDGVNDEVVSALRAPAVDFTLRDGVLHYAKYYHYGIYQSVDFLLEFADTPEELYSEEGTLTFADGKLTMTHEKTTTIEDFAARYYDRYNVTNFADLMQAMKNR